MKRVLVFILSLLLVACALMPAAAAVNEVTMPPVDETPAPETTAPVTTAAEDEPLAVEDALPWVITVLTALIAAMIFYVIYLRAKNASRF